MGRDEKTAQYFQIFLQPAFTADLFLNMLRLSGHNYPIIGETFSQILPTQDQYGIHMI
jgi:pyoverdine/dityrosine biosynthesis protein Dit1